MFMLFAGATCYPDGGWNDFRGAFDDAEAAKSEGRRLVAVKEPFVDWWHVASLATHTIVASYTCGEEITTD